MKAITAYVCEFCPKRRPFKTKGSGTRHEKHCYRNPETHSCVTCKHFSMEEAEHDEYFTSHVPSCAIEADGFYSMNPEREEIKLQSHCGQWEPKISSPAAISPIQATESEAARKDK